MHSGNRLGALEPKAIVDSEEAFAHQLAELDRQLKRSLDWMIPADMGGYLDAEDVAQEAYLEAFTRIRTFVPRGPNGFEAWVKTIATNKLLHAVERHRALKRGRGWVRVTNRRPSRGRALSDGLDALVAPGRSPSDAAVHQEELEELDRAVEGLPSHYRQTLRLVYMEQLPFKAAARQMQRTPSAMNNICVRARRRLMRSLGVAAFPNHGRSSSCRPKRGTPVHFGN